MMQDCEKALFEHFAMLLEYPTPAIGQQAGECGRVLAGCSLQAATAIAGFTSLINQESLSRLEEIYTSTFDLQGVCCPYVGHQLFGESYKRSWFMARLSQEYRQKSFPTGKELPDHVSVILHFLGHADGDEFSRVLLDDGLRPAVDKMVPAFDKAGENPYKLVLGALSVVLRELQPETAARLVDAEKGGQGDG